MNDTNEPISYGWKWMSLMTITISKKLITWRMKCTWMKFPNMHDYIWIKMTIIPIDLLVYLYMWDIMYLVCIPPLTRLFPSLPSKGHLPKTHENFVEWHWDSPNVRWVNVITFTQFVFCELAWNSHSIVFVESHYIHPTLCSLKQALLYSPNSMFELCVSLENLLIYFNKHWQ
jgi:hypothetical protein